jgi:hypothetical protein
MNHRPSLNIDGNICGATKADSNEASAQTRSLYMYM